jgi:hypothetical protein
MCKGGSKASSTVDPRIMGMVQSNYANAQGVANRPYQPYTGQMTAPLTPAREQAGGLLQAAPGMGQGALMSGVNAAQSGTQYQAPLIAPASYSPSQATPGQMGAPAQVGQLPMIAAPTGLSQLSGYLNPYQQNVVDTTMSDLNRQNEIALNNTNQGATAENAFGGTRNAVADSLTNDAYARAAASTLANLNSQGFNTAAGLLQNNQQMGLNAGGQNLSAALNAALANTNAQNNASQFNAGNSQGANIFNAGAANAAGQYNAGQSLATQQSNQGATNTAAGLNNQAAGSLGSLGYDQGANYLNGVNALNAWGGQQQQTQQNALTAAYQQYLAQMGYPVQMQTLLNSALASGMGAGTSNPTAAGQSAGGLLGGLGSLGSAAAALIPLL